MRNATRVPATRAAPSQTFKTIPVVVVVDVSAVSVVVVVVVAALVTAVVVTVDRGIPNTKSIMKRYI
jgi:hypothetical protein